MDVVEKHFMKMAGDHRGYKHEYRHRHRQGMGLVSGTLQVTDLEPTSSPGRIVAGDMRSKRNVLQNWQKRVRVDDRSIGSGTKADPSDKCMLT